MQSYTGATFNRGPVARVLDLAISVQESQGKIPLDEELKRFARTVTGSSAASWVCPVSTAAAVIEFVADSLVGGVLDGTPVEFQEKLRRASEGMDSGDYLRTLAGTLRPRQGVAALVPRTSHGGLGSGGHLSTARRIQWKLGRGW